MKLDVAKNNPKLFNTPELHGYVDANWGDNKDTRGGSASTFLSAISARQFVASCELERSGEVVTPGALGSTLLDSNAHKMEWADGARAGGGRTAAHGRFQERLGRSLEFESSCDWILEGPSKAGTHYRAGAPRGPLVGSQLHQRTERSQSATLLRQYGGGAHPDQHHSSDSVDDEGQ